MRHNMTKNAGVRHKGTGVWDMNNNKVAGYCLKVLGLELTI